LHDITQIMMQVVSEAVEIVDNQNAHARTMEVPKYSRHRELARAGAVFHSCLQPDLG
jgi:hypothetical protein